MPPQVRHGGNFSPCSKTLRSEAVDRETFNNAVRRLAIKVDQMEKKLSRQGFRSHHEITTDGIAATFAIVDTTRQEWTAPVFGNPVAKRDRMRRERERMDAEIWKRVRGRCWKSSQVH